MRIYGWLKYSMSMAVLVLTVSACSPAPQQDSGRPGKSAPDSEPAIESAPAAKLQPSKGDTITLSDGTQALFWAQADVRGKDAFRVEMGEDSPGRFYFSPTVLIGSPGQRLILEIVNTSSEGHPFDIDGSSQSARVEAGGKTTVTVQFPSEGAVAFSCPHGGHAGELRVG